MPEHPTFKTMTIPRHRHLPEPAGFEDTALERRSRRSTASPPFLRPQVYVRSMVVRPSPARTVAVTRGALEEIAAASSANRKRLTRPPGLPWPGFSRRRW